jgi:hypothetical protein
MLRLHDRIIIRNRKIIFLVENEREMLVEIATCLGWITISLNYYLRFSYVNSICKSTHFSVFANEAIMLEAFVWDI